MRRKDRQVTDPAEIRAILSSSDICHLAFCGDDGFPYIVPVHFGFTLEDRRLTLYFHGARAGRKYELMQRDARVAFCVCAQATAYCEDTEQDMRACKWSAYYGSVTGRGVAKELAGAAEKRAALENLMRRVTGRQGFGYDPDVLERTGVFVVTAEDFSAKQNKKKEDYRFFAGR